MAALTFELIDLRPGLLDDRSWMPSMATQEPPDPAPQTTSLPSHPIDRKTALVVAVIAVVGVFLGGLIAAASSYWTTKSNSEQALDEYRRDTRRDAYLQTLRDFDEFIAWKNGIELELDLLNAGEDRLTEQQFKTKIAEAQTRYDELFAAMESDCATNELVASIGVVQVCEVILDTNYYLPIFNYRNGLRKVSNTRQYNEALGAGGRPNCCHYEYPPNINGNSSNLDLRAELVKVARHDLGATD